MQSFDMVIMINLTSCLFFVRYYPANSFGAEPNGGENEQTTPISAVLYLF